MARPEKVAVVDRVTQEFTDAAATLLTDYRGLTVTELAELRAELRKVDATYAVVKNTLARIAAGNAGMDGLDELLTGPTAIVFCGEDPVGPAKALKAFAKDHEELLIKGGYLDGQVLDAEDALKLADLASREELLGTLAGMMNNALAGFARLLQAAPSQMVRLMAALEQDGGVEAKGFSPEAPAPVEAAEEATEAADDAAEATADAAVEAADEVTEAAAEAPEAVEDAADAVAEAADDAAEAAEDTPAEGAAGAVAETVKDAADAAPAVAAGAAETVAEAAESAAETVGEVAETVAEKVADAAEAVTDTVESATADDADDSDSADSADSADSDD